MYHFVEVNNVQASSSSQKESKKSDGNDSFRFWEKRLGKKMGTKDFFYENTRKMLKNENWKTYPEGKM